MQSLIAARAPKARPWAIARFFFSYDGDQFDQNLLPEDREAIGAVQSAIQNWGKLTLVYRGHGSRHHHFGDE